jgi:phosphoribosylformimino-5-aminoimidazole carboxamide ribotide isomerase
MAKTDIIPAIDILSGKCVRLSQGDYARSTVYNADPVEVALMFEDAGITRLHLVDLDGAREKHIVNYEVLERIALKTKLTIDFGGGLKSGEDLRIAFECGAAMVTGGSIAVREPETFLGWLQHYGPEKILLGADAREGKIAISGWQDTSDTDIIPFITWWVEQGIHTVISTDIARDGMLTGPATDLYREILSHLPGVALIASGGISSMEEIFLLAETGLQGVITGKAIYEGKISLREIYQYNKAYAG